MLVSYCWFVLFARKDWNPAHKYYSFYYTDEKERERKKLKNKEHNMKWTKESEKRAK